jgi:vacuolar iron transporter family protein
LLGVAIAAEQQMSANPFKLVLAGALAATFAESISMGAVAYTSTLARRDHYLAEEAREKREMVEVPDLERSEVRNVLRGWGFEGAELEDVLERIVSKPKAWLEFMMAYELNLAPIDIGQPRKSAFLVGFAAIFGSAIPLIPFLFFPTAIVNGMIASVIVAAVALFAIGWYKAKTTVGRPTRSGLQMIAIGITSAFAGFLIAYAIGAGPIG